MMESATDQHKLDEFFGNLNHLGKWYVQRTSKVPKALVINPDILRDVAKLEGFFQRPELEGRVTAYAPVVRWLKLDFGMVLLIEEYMEDFLHFSND